MLQLIFGVFCDQENMDDNTEEISPSVRAAEGPAESGGEVGTNREEQGDEVKVEGGNGDEYSPGEQVRHVFRMAVENEG